MIRYLDHSIIKCENIHTKEQCYQLKHWFVSDESPNFAGCREAGYFKTYKEAEDHHHKMLVEGLLKDETT